jgi:hypothetical protein
MQNAEQGIKNADVCNSGVFFHLKLNNHFIIHQFICSSVRHLLPATAGATTSKPSPAEAAKPSPATAAT